MKYRSFYRWHIWLGWLVGVPLILWTASGLFMVAKPIEEVRGENLKREPIALSAIRPVAPLLEGRAAKSVTLEQREDGPVWVVQYLDGGARRADALTGKLLPGVSAPEAMAIAAFNYSGKSKPVSAKLFSAEQAPIDLRKKRPSWQVSYADGTRLYIDADSASLLAVRTKWWRAYDFMWGLHIMDLQTREDNHHPTLIGFAAFSLIALLMAFGMLIARQRRKSLSGNAQETVVSD